jgi:hypothetical protein
MEKDWSITSTTWKRPLTGQRASLSRIRVATAEVVAIIKAFLLGGGGKVSLHIIKIAQVVHSSSIIVETIITIAKNIQSTYPGSPHASQY